MAHINSSRDIKSYPNGSSHFCVRMENTVQQIRERPMKSSALALSRNETQHSVNTKQINASADRFGWAMIPVINIQMALGRKQKNKTKFPN